MRKVFYDSFDYTLATIVPEIAHIPGNSFQEIFVTMNFSDRCDTVHVFHSQQSAWSRLFIHLVRFIPFFFLSSACFNSFPFLLVRRFFLKYNANDEHRFEILTKVTRDL